jgi:hypothetical protein
MDNEKLRIECIEEILEATKELRKRKYWHKRKIINGRVRIRNKYYAPARPYGGELDGEIAEFAEYPHTPGLLFLHSFPGYEYESQPNHFGGFINYLFWELEKEK